MKKTTARQNSVGKKINSLKINPWIVALFGFIVFVGISMAMNGDKRNTLNSSAAGYSPKIKPKDFTTTITNKYLSLPVGRIFIYEAETDEGLERNEIEITGETKMVMGVKTLVYRDRDYLEGELMEDTRDYLAQDKEGNVWYFGEDVDNYENGEIINHDGTWLAGVDGAQPGIWVKNNPRKGETYLQEYYEGEAEDTVTVLSLNERVKTPMGTFTNCLKTYDWTPLDPDSREHKYYCPQVNAKVLTRHLIKKEKAYLIKIENMQDDEDNEKDEDDD